MDYNIVVCGSRNLNNKGIIISRISNIQSSLIGNNPEPNIILHSGGAKGIDKAAEKAAKDLDYPFIEHLAQWDTFGKSAGYKRNSEMLKLADHIIAVWDGKSNGTKHMVENGMKKNIPMDIIIRPQ